MPKDHARRTGVSGQTGAGGREDEPSRAQFSLPAGYRSLYGLAPPVAAGGGGAPLHEGVRARMEKAFGADFSDVRVHQGSQARSIGALAYTQGADIHFAAGQYQPESPAGQKLLGHELTHIVQQRAGLVSAPQNKGGINADTHLEREADELGARAAAGERVQVAGAGQGVQPKLAADGAPIQRAVGFEFETTANSGMPSDGVELTNAEKTALPYDCGGPNGWIKPGTGVFVEPMRKGTTLLELGRFELQADERANGASDIEFVIPPRAPAFEENKTDRGELKTTMDNVVRVAEVIAQADKISLRQVATRAGGHAPLPAAMIANGANMTGQPQTTAAIRIDQMARFIEENGPDQVDPASTEGGRTDLMLSAPNMMFEFSDIPNAPGLARTGITNYAVANQVQITGFNQGSLKPILGGNQGSNALVGMMALLINYLRKADGIADGPGAGTLAYPKALAAIMARTDLASIFATVPEYGYFNMYSADWAQMVFTASGTGGALADPLFRRGVRDETGVQNVTFDRLTRRDWLTNLCIGIDMLTRVNFPSGDQDFNKKYIDGSMGGLGNRMEQVGTKDRKVDAPIFELRRLRQSVPIDQWRGFAIDIYDYLCALNDLKDRPYRRRHQYPAQDGVTRY